MTGIAAAVGQADAANTAALIEMENNSNVKNAVKAAINDAKDYLGTKAKAGGEKLANLLEKLEVQSMVERKEAIKAYLEEAGTRGGLTEAEITTLAVIYAANEALFPTSVLDFSLPGAGKAISKVGKILKGGAGVESAARVAEAEARAATRSPSGPVFKTTKDATAAAEAMGFQRVSEKVNNQAVYRKGNVYITRDIDSHNGGAWKMADSVKNLGSKQTRDGTYNADLSKRIGD